MILERPITLRISRGAVLPMYMVFCEFASLEFGLHDSVSRGGISLVAWREMVGPIGGYP